MLKRSAPVVSGVKTPPFEYRWRYDAGYYSTVIDRQYQQLPRILHLPVQFTILWLIWVGIYSAVTGEALREFVGWALLIGTIGIPGLCFLTKKAIFLKYRVRPSFGSQASYSMSDAGITIDAESIHGTYPWSVYARAVRFSDGLLLVKKGGIRWLPDSALRAGSVEDAVALVRAHLPMRIMG